MAALLSVPAIIIESSTGDSSLRGLAFAFDWVIWAAFAAEAGTLLYLSEDRWSWLREHPLDVAIVILTPPFLPGPLQALQVLRLLRILRLVRLVMLARQLFSLDGIKYAALVVVVTVLAGGVAFASVEHVSDWDGIWWAMTTVTTVGYGDPPVTTDAGRVVAIVIMISGIGFVSLITGALAVRFTDKAERTLSVEDEILSELRRLHERMDQLERDDTKVS